MYNTQYKQHTINDYSMNYANTITNSPRFIRFSEIVAAHIIRCESSSQVNDGYACEHAYNTSIQARPGHEWASGKGDSAPKLNLTFEHQITITSVEIWWRCVDVDQFRELLFTFSDSTT